MNKYKKFIKILLFSIIVLITNISCSDKKREKENFLSLTVPLYIYPTTVNPKTKNSYWNDVILSKSDKTDINVIINPTNGDHSKYKDKNFFKGIEKFKDAEIEVFGYTYTRYAKRDDKYIKKSIDFYKKEYGVENIFFDETNSSIKVVGYYKKLYKYMKSNSNSSRLILNPGTIPNEIIMHDNKLQRVVFEGNYDNFIKHFSKIKLSKKLRLYNICLVYDVKKDKMKKVIDLAVLGQCGQLYVTDDRGDNPWDTLPSYWNEEIKYVDKLN